MAYKYNEDELTGFAQECASGVSDFINGACVAEEVSKSDLGRTLDRKGNDALLLEVSKQYAKFADDRADLRLAIENGSVQNFMSIIQKIVDCCEENNWFETE